MNLAPIASIEVSPNRQRREFKEAELRELADSIENQDVGLIHPIAVRDVGGRLVLVAGERRIRAISDSHALGVTVWHGGKPIPEGMIPYISLGEMEPLAAWEAELEENIRRTDLTWQEKAQATEQLFALRAAQAAQAGQPHPSPSTLAKELTGETRNAAQEKIRQELLLARQLHDPDIAKAATLFDAVKVLKRKEETRRNERIAEQVGRTFSSADHKVFHEDSQVWLAACPADTFDVILTDPPYGMDADTFGDSGGKAAGAHGYADSAENLREIMEWFAPESFRVTKPQAHLYLFCDFDWFSEWEENLHHAGWTVFRTPLIWVKPQGYRAPWPDKGPQRSYETILYAVKGDKLVKKMARDVLVYPPDENLGHAAQKPVALFADLLSRSAGPGDTILDPFAGTGPLLPAAHAAKCRATLIELDPASYGIAASRLKDLK